jgi:hypothetical protein
MPSYQDIESRLRTVESQINFVLTSSRVEVSRATGLIKPDGSSEIVKFVGNMKDIWRLSQQFPQDVMPDEPAQDATLTDSEAVNG